MASEHNLISGEGIGPPLKDLLFELGLFLKSQRYEFITVTPETHERFLGKALKPSADGLRDIFGWSLPFSADLLERLGVSEAFVSRAVVEGLFEKSGSDSFLSRYRCSSIGDHLYFHSRFPTDQADSVFFGPDTYRFVRFLASELRGGARLLDLGCGSGAGGLEFAMRFEECVLSDINLKAVELAEVNARLASRSNCVCVQSELFTRLSGDFDAVIANPPFLMDESQRSYRHGGEAYGSALSMRIVEESVKRLTDNSKLCLYTASAIVGGRDLFKAELERRLPELGIQAERWAYSEIDADIFGDEISRPAYREVERLAAVGLVITRSKR